MPGRLVGETVDVSPADARAVDRDANSAALRAALAADHPAQVMLEHIQHDLFDVGGELCIPGHTLVTAAYVERLERAIDAVNADLPPLKDFILPGGSPAAAQAHVARTVARRAERRTLTLMMEETVNPLALQYLNRLSDYLFVLARALARADGGQEVLWRPRQRNTFRPATAGYPPAAPPGAR